MKRYWKAAAWSFIFIASTLSAGCGKGLNEVKGKVTHDGQPVAGLQVLFEPVDPSIGTNAIGFTKADGSYVLHYPGDAIGAPKGDYIVRITGGEPDKESSKPIQIAARFNTASELKQTVKSGENTCNFEIGSK